MTVLTRETLRSAYELSRATAVFVVAGRANPPPSICRYCGRHWRHWAGSKLDGHAICVVTVEFQRAVLALYRSDPRLSVTAISETCDVTSSVARAWIKHAERAVSS